MSSLILEEIHVVEGIAAVADAFAATVSSDIVDGGEWGRICFLVHKAVGATGTSTLTMEACSTITATATTAIPFYSRTIAALDTEGAITARAATGFNTTAGSNDFYLCEVRADALASTGYRYVRLTAVEVADSPVLGGIIVLLGEARYNAAVDHSAID